MCHLQNIPRKESVTTGQTDAGQSDPYVPLCFAGNTKISLKVHQILFYTSNFNVIYFTAQAIQQNPDEPGYQVADG